MTLEKAIQEAEKNGFADISRHAMPEDLRWLLAVTSPAFWQALGKARGWGEQACLEHGFNGRFDDYHRDCGKCMGKEYKGYVYQMHCFIDHLADGKDADSFFQNL